MSKTTQAGPVLPFTYCAAVLYLDLCRTHRVLADDVANFSVAVRKSNENVCKNCSLNTNTSNFYILRHRATYVECSNT